MKSQTNVVRCVLRNILALQLLILPAAVGTAADVAPGLVTEQPAEGRFVETNLGFMIPYSQQIPGTDVTFEMVPVPGGKFTMGSPPTEENRKDDEGPQFIVEVPPFWMGKYEVTWGEYKQYMEMHDIFKDFVAYEIRCVHDDNMVDAVTAPSNLYDPTFTFEPGEDPRQPAITMTQFAAKQYTKWLSGLTGDFYRLPSEAEWEYACRAGTTTAYSFGDDVGEIDDYVWHFGNAGDVTHKVGEKKPNPWGLYDMHGNVAEWTLDQYVPDHYAQFAGKEVKARETIAWPTKLYPRTLRGGGWEFAPESCRCASRFPSASEDEWKEEDPNFPKSPWWFTSSPSTSVGMRIMRPLMAPGTTEEKSKFWEADLDLEIKEVAMFRIHSEGRGAIGIVDKRLPDAIEMLEVIKKYYQKNR